MIVPSQELAAEPAVPMVSMPMTSYLSTPQTEVPDADTERMTAKGDILARPVSHPLGPIVVKVRVERPVIGRLYAMGLACAAMAILMVAAHLVPSDHHLGTHRQLGLPTCGFILMTGFPCPTCGMTTAYAFMVHGHVLEALRSNVAGSIMAIGTAGVFAISLWCAIRGYYVTVNWYRIDAVRVVWMATLLIVGSWALNIALGLLQGSLPVR